MAKKNHTINKTLICKLLTCCILLSALSIQTVFAQKDRTKKPYDYLKLIDINTPDSLTAIYYYNAALYSDNYDMQIKYLLNTLQYCPKKNHVMIASTSFKLARAYWYKSESRQALPHAINSCNIYKSLHDSLHQANAYVLMAQCYSNLKMKDSSFFFFNEAEKLFSAKYDTTGLTMVFRNAGSASLKIRLRNMAETYFNKAILLDSLAHNSMNLGLDYYYLGYINIKDSIKLAKEYLKKAINILSTNKTNDNYYNSYLNFSYNSLAQVYLAEALENGDEQLADYCYFYIKKVGNYFLDQSDFANHILLCYTYVDYLVYKKKYKEALEEMVSIKKFLGADHNSKAAEIYNSEMTSIYEKLGNYKMAFEYQAKMYESRIEYISDSSVTSIANFHAEQAVIHERLEQKRIEAEKKILWITVISLGCLILLITLFTFYIFRLLRIKRKANNTLMLKNRILATQKAEIEDQKSEIEKQKSEIEIQKNVITGQWLEVETVNKKLINSIEYARRIQGAVISSTKDVDKVFKENFVYYRPRDIVSGDFYRAVKCGRYSVMITADCTGHGIPGGFLSMLGISSLKEFMSTENDAANPGSVLDRMRTFLKTTLISEADKTVDDGMDMTVCCFDFEKMELRYAIANQTAVIVRKGTAIKLKGDTMPVGRYVREDCFQTLSIPLEHGDMVYMYSDGIQDQLGGETRGFGRKFLGKNLHNLLISFAEEDLGKQCAILHNTITTWRNGRQQVDDMTMIGIRVE